MAERSVKVRLQAVVQDFKRQMGEAASATEQVGASAGQAEQKTSSLSRAGEAIGSTIKAAAVIGTGAVAALGVSTLKTGLAYNQLEQNSRAALTTLLGSSEAAHAQMDELSEFVKTALFPREVFIEAQQQLLAFGFAAEDVIPALSAIQDAVAATGGSAQDFQEVSRILAQVQSTGKLTAETLNQLGYRGINAAQLIGEAMGKTEAEIRDSITAGTLDGREALTVLVDAMETEFEGAAALISDTWQGASGLVAAAMRDIGSSLAEPFISKQGGGAAIDWAVALSELLYALQEQIDPLVQTVAQDAGPAFDNITGMIESATEAVAGADFSGFLDSVKDLSPALVGLGAAGATAGVGMIPFLDQFTEGLKAGVIGIAAFVLTSPEMRDLLRELFEALAPLGPPLLEIAGTMTGVLSSGLATTAELLSPLVELVAGAVGWFSELSSPLQTAVTVLGGLVLLRGPLGVLGTNLTAFGVAARNLPGQIRGGPEQVGFLARSVRGLRTAAGGLLGMFGGPWGLAIGGAVTALGIWGQQNKEAEAHVDDLAGSLDEQTGAITDNTREIVVNQLEKDGLLKLADELGISLEDVADAALGEEDAQRRVNAALDEAIRKEEAAKDERGRGTVTRDKAKDSANELRDAIFGENEQLDAAAESARRKGEATDGASEAAKRGKSATEAFGEEVNETRIDVDDLNQSLKELFESHWSAEEAADAQRTTLNNLSEKISDADERAKEAEDSTERWSKSLEGNSQEAIDNRETLRRLVEQTSDMITEDIKAGDTKEDVEKRTEKYKKELEKELTQLGFNKEEVRDYTGVLDEVPEQVKTETTVEGREAAVDEINKVKAAINNIDDKSISITAAGYLQSEGGGSVQVYPGPIPFATGGPVRGPGSGTSDDIPAWLSNGEYVINADATQQYGPLLDLINARKFATGGPVGNALTANVDGSRLNPPAFSSFAERVIDQMTDVLSKTVGKLARDSGPLNWARSQAGKPYHWGGVGPAGYDCSGFMSAIVNVIKGRSPHSRLFATGNFPTGDFTRGDGRFSIGSRRGNPGHMAGTLLGTNVESRGGEGVVVGSRARGARDSLFGGNVWSLKGFAQGGRVEGDPPFDLIDPEGKHFKPELFDQGGRLMPGQFGFNGTGTPETVLSPDESAKFDQLIAALTGASGATGFGFRGGLGLADQVQGLTDTVVRLDDATEKEWQALLLAGWQGRAGDEMEALYPPISRSAEAFDELAREIGKATDSMRPSGPTLSPLQKAAKEMLGAVKGGTRIAEDFTFKGMPKSFNADDGVRGELLDLFYKRNKGFDFGGDKGFRQLLEKLLKSVGGGKSFDTGGRLMPGQWGFNGTSVPETVLSPRESAAFDDLVANLGSMRPAPTAAHYAGAGEQGQSRSGFNLTVVSPMDEQVDTIQRRLAYAELASRTVMR